MATKSSPLGCARSAAGHTQETLAFALGVSVSTVGRWEAGASEPLPTTRPKLAKLLNMSLAQLDQVLQATDAPAGQKPASADQGAGPRRTHSRYWMSCGGRSSDAPRVPTTPTSRGN
ncbi:multiprotein-bridging factor 1 family protein [Amycolatopsis japonica]|uniref:helix-turn-helix domain-containing protein n=1 Tax=Amycolatopsis japonica TaxID=208439 RepID=UPI003671E4FD